MLRLRVDGPENQVSLFLKDFISLPQHQMKSVSTSYRDGEFMGEMTLSCAFEHHPLSKIHQPITVIFQTTDGNHISFTLLRGSVCRSGNMVTISGQAASGLLD